MDEDLDNDTVGTDDRLMTSAPAFGAWAVYLLGVILLCVSMTKSWQFDSGLDTTLEPITGGATAALLGLIGGCLAAAAAVLTVDGKARRLGFGLTFGFGAGAIVGIVLVAETLVKDGSSSNVQLGSGADLAIFAVLMVIGAAALGRRRL